MKLAKCQTFKFKFAHRYLLLAQNFSRITD